MCMDADAPPPRNYGMEMNDILSSQINNAPALFNAYRTYSPLYSAEQMHNLETTLLGSQERDIQETNYTPKQVYRNRATGALSDTLPKPPTPPEVGAGTAGGKLGIGQNQAQLFPEQWDLVTINQPSTVTRHVPGQRGLLDLYSKDILPKLSSAQAAAASQQRAADIADVRRLGPQAQAAFRAANPQQAKLLDALNDSAMSGVQAGSRLGADDIYQINSRVRGDWANRGLGTSQPAMLDESLQQFGGGQNLLRQRQQFGLQTAELNKATSVDPFLTILGRPSTAVNSAGGISGQGQSLISGVPNLNPESSYAQDLFNTNYNAEAAAKIAEANANAAVCAAGIQAGGSILGGAAGACWVAREVFGNEMVEDAYTGVTALKWILFRTWLLDEAPAWFRELYLAHGESFAKWIHNKPRLKRIIKRWMEKKVAHVALRHGGRRSAPSLPLPA